MLNKISLNLYQGTGQTIKERNLQLPLYTQTYSGLEDRAGYVVDPDSGLRDAVNVAIALGQPLLLTGEPGTGKTALAGGIAHELTLELFPFYTKTTSTATDLFYQYDALARFHDSRDKDRTIDLEKYITCQALGKAILLAMQERPPEAHRIFPDLQGKEPARSVVLIDEIDKAPRDLPNDILHEIDAMEFRIKETDWPSFRAGREFRPIVILTSNSERNLPDAFLRRCVFYHIEFPSNQTLKKIVASRFRASAIKPLFSEKFLDAAYDHFQQLRGLNLKKPPATAEFLAWISILKTLDIEPGQLREQPGAAVELSYSVLAKTREDRDIIRKWFNGL